MPLMRRIIAFFKKETVLCIAAVCAILSMFAVPPDMAYLEYIDLRVLCLLFCLMAVILGMQDCGLFGLLAQKLLRGQKSLRVLLLILVLLPFFVSMLVTNDVALITFVPFTLMVLEAAGAEHLIIKTVVLQTVAANLGSMATPVGNPQNLYLYSYYQLTGGQFFGVMLPLTLVSLLGLTAAALCTKNSRISVSFPQAAKISSHGRLAVYTALFLLCLLSVFRILPYWVLTAVVIICFLFVRPRLLLRVDFSLLLTFCCFFIFSGNLGRIPAVSSFLSGVLEQSTLLSSALASQVISNVPAAVLLSGFTGDWRGLLAGVNIGGLGTPVASLASLISLKLYFQSKKHRTGRYLAWFTAANLIGLAVLLMLALLLGW